MISVELLNSLRDGTPEADMVVDQTIAGETMRQTNACDLPTRPRKERDEQGRPIPSAPAFRKLQEETLSGPMTRLIGRSCELGAFDPDDLRNLVTSRITRHMSDERLAELEAEEQAEKADLERIIRRLERR
jgi:hypothetical protein